jgi:RimJ/RimL family protein N-acetyltransferase
MQFYPEDAIVPEELRTEEFCLRPLRASDAEIDYAAVMDSKVTLRVMSQSSWPSDEFTLEMNRKDLEKHEEEHDERTAFTYTVLDPTESTCLGCVYVGHLKEGPMKGDHAAMLRFWVRQLYLEGDLDRRLLESLIDWFRNEWAFSCVVLTIADADERQNQLANDLDLQLVHAYGNKWSEYLIKSTQ